MGQAPLAACYPLRRSLSVYVPPFRFALRVASTPQAPLAACYPLRRSLSVRPPLSVCSPCRVDAAGSARGVLSVATLPLSRLRPPLSVRSPCRVDASLFERPPCSMGLTP